MVSLYLNLIMAGCSASLLLVALCAFFGTIAAVQVNEACGTRSVVSNFDIEAWSGTWYEISRYTNPLQGDGQCATTEAYIEENGVDLRLNNYMVVFDPEFTVLEDTILGRASFPNSVPPLGSFNMSYTGDYSRENFLILATDYENYSIAWSCEDNDDNTSEQWAWVFSRIYYVRDTVVDELEGQIETHLTRGLLHPTIHDDALCLGGEISPTL